jgi:phosphatidylserine decarboxylase
MELSRPVARLTPFERLNFLVTNRIPRRWLTLFMGWFSRIENPLVRTMSIACWRLFADDLRLHEAKKSRFRSLHDCFIRELKPGMRPINEDPHVLTSPCDAVIGEFGDVEGLEVIQAKGFPYSIGELFADDARAETYRDGRFVTLRLKSSMYHRFHAPCDGRISTVNYISGDTWNVNPVALKVVERLFCRNERAVMTLESASLGPVTLVPVAAVLVASMRIHGIDEALNLRYTGPNRIACDVSARKGDELGYFEHGSTIVLFVTGEFEFVEGLATGTVVRMGEPLMHRRSG